MSLNFEFFSVKGSAQEAETKKTTTEIVFAKTQKSAIPKPIGIVNDFGRIYTESQRTELFKILRDYKSQTTRQIVVVTIDSIKPYTDIQKFARALELQKIMDWP